MGILSFLRRVRRQKRVIGLTGSVGCGKSSVAKILAAKGLPVIDADQVAREITEPGTAALAAIAQAFGAGVLDPTGALNRAVLRKTVFGDPAKRSALEAILHPAIRRRSQELMDAAFKAGFDTVIYEASLILETGRYREFNAILLVTCDPAQQEVRLLKRDRDMSVETARSMMATQMPQEEKLKYATWTIENSGPESELERKTLEWAKIAQVSFESSPR